MVGIGWRHPHYQALADANPALDFLEVHSENFFAEGGVALAVLMAARQDYAVSLHGVGLSLGSAVGLDTWHLEQLAQLVERVEPLRVSDHASFARGAVPGQAAGRSADVALHANDLLPIPFNEEALQALCRNVQQVQERLRRPILVENLSAYLRWDAAAAGTAYSEPEFLNQLAHRSGCQLLVDVNNIYVNALNDLRLAHPTGKPPAVDALAPLALQQCQDWLDAIEPAVVGEMHVAGHLHVDDQHGCITIDDHGSRVCPEVWALHRHALRRFGANLPTLVEWDTGLPALQVLLDEAQIARTHAHSLLAGAA